MLIEEAHRAGEPERAERGQERGERELGERRATPVTIRHTSPHVSICQHMSAYVGIREDRFGYEEKVTEESRHTRRPRKRRGSLSRPQTRATYEETKREERRHTRRRRQRRGTRAPAVGD